MNGVGGDKQLQSPFVGSGDKVPLETEGKDHEAHGARGDGRAVQLDSVGEDYDLIQSDCEGVPDSVLLEGDVTGVGGWYHLQCEGNAQDGLLEETVPGSGGHDHLQCNEAPKDVLFDREGENLKKKRKTNSDQ